MRCHQCSLEHAAIDPAGRGVQLVRPCVRRYDGWVTEMKDEKARHQMGKASGLDNLLYSGDAGVLDNWLVACCCCHLWEWRAIRC